MDGNGYGTRGHFDDNQRIVMKNVESFHTIYEPAEGFYKDKGSKFIARLRHVESEEDCKTFLEEVKKEFYDARHHCYAYRLDAQNERFRANDDGEPSGSAGKPILNQILSKELFDVMIIVVRYFGGTKLGVSGLIQAYKTAAREAIDFSDIILKDLTEQFELHFEYPKMNDVMRIIKEEKITILEQDFSVSCVIKIEIKKSRLSRSFFRLENLYGLDIKPLKNS